ncbi:hypothetical protein ABTX81_36605 [Kitasatospora sp. NPDC097605]|uniref:hypothetical protein n=1 Tax=Kitasatospora sp. NPDC097605 TaxID=3157226 RepID=UPI003328C132
MESIPASDGGVADGFADDGPPTTARRRRSRPGPGTRSWGRRPELRSYGRTVRVTGEWYGETYGSRVVRYRLNPASSATDPGLLTTSADRTVVQDAFTTPGYRGLQGGTTWTDAQGVVEFAFSKGCGTEPAVLPHTWTGDTRPGRRLWQRERLGRQLERRLAPGAQLLARTGGPTRSTSCGA